VFDLPDDEWTTEVRRLRAAYDPDRVSFPVEITVAGSSGLGWFSPTQSPQFIAKHVRALAQDWPRFACAFGGVEVFPASQVYYLALEDEAPFHEFQESLAGSVLEFEPTPFAYKPHCTLVRLSADAVTAQAALLAFPVPAGRIIISSVSLYSVDLAKNACRFVDRFALGA
jgi:2'-5' RNA ligase